MAKRTWSDQPAALDSCDVITSLNVRDGNQVEIRRRFVGGDGPAENYVTIGNLFQSQTLKCDDIDAVFRALNKLPKGKENMDLPEGCKLMENIK